MDIRHYFTIIAVALTVQANALNYRDMEFPTLEVPEMEGESYSLLEPIYAPEQSTYVFNEVAPMPSPKMDFDFFKSKTNPDIKPYKFMDDLTFVGIPLFVAGWAVKGDKAMFRVNQKAEDGGKKNTQLLTDFKTGIDDYTQFFGPAMVVGLKVGGYEGRSDWPRLLASAGMSYAIMAGFVNGIKYSAKEMRPDGSTANSWPSGHTATAFVGATLLHKEYGLTRSPWWSVAGYGVATATGVMRVLNNRHWISDVMSGAGIGIMSTELGYALCDLMFKQKGLLRNDLVLDSEKPSFFSISMGLGLGSKDLEFESEGEKVNIKFRAATVVDAEGAYFFNKYIGVGGRLRVRAQSAKDFGDFASLVAAEDYYAWQSLLPYYMDAFPGDYRLPATTEQDQFFNEQSFLGKVGYQIDSESSWNDNAPVTDSYGIVKSDHITEFTGSVGVYFNLPLSNHFSLGTKALIGRSITQPAISLNDLQYPNNTGEKWSDDWEYLTVGAKSSTSFGTGLSFTYRYRSNFSWRLFCDYDYTRKDFTAKYDPFHFVQESMTSGASFLTDAALETATGDYADGLGLEVREYRARKTMNYWTLGLSFLVNF